jgi:hypothetical protein
MVKSKIVVISDFVQNPGFVDKDAVAGTPASGSVAQGTGVERCTALEDR